MAAPRRRPRLLPLSAALPTLLALTALVGYLLMQAPVREHPAGAVARAGGAPSTATRPRGGEATAGVAAPLPLRIEDAGTTITGRPGWAASHRPTATTAHPAHPAHPAHAHPATPAGPVTPATGRRHTARMPSAARRDADLAAWLQAHGITSTTYDSAGQAWSRVGRDDSPSATSAASTDTTPTGADAGGSPRGSASSGGSTTSAGVDFGLASFNVLGASHTRNGARGRASGVVRIRWAAQLLARHDVDVVGFQELQQEQARELLRVTGGSYALYPGPGRGRDSDNSVGWRTSQWQLVTPTTISIPYFNGHHRSMPVVLLRNRATGVKAWFGNFHNPAETSRYHHQQHWRDLATDAEVAMANRIVATGTPLFVTGDMNERATYFCRFTARTRMHAARGGSNGSDGCRAGRPRAVDWIFGSPTAAFSGYDEDRTHLVDITTDHPVISTRVHLDATR